MLKEQWIEERMVDLKKNMEKYPEQVKIPDHTLQWISDMLESAWSRGRTEGSEQAYENAAKWQREAFELARQ